MDFLSNFQCLGYKNIGEANIPFKKGIRGRVGWPPQPLEGGVLGLAVKGWGRMGLSRYTTHPPIRRGGPVGAKSMGIRHDRKEL